MARETRKLVMGTALIALFITASIAGCLMFDEENDNNGGTMDDPPIGKWSGPLLDDRNATEKGIDDIVDANNLFGIDILQKISEEEEGNIFISPYSIFTALSMTYEGAEGNTETEMAEVMHLPQNDKERLGSFASIQNDINTGSSDYELATANAIWPQEGGNFKELFLDAIKQYYYGKVQELDYAGNAEAARITINDWVENQTNDRIKDLIPPGMIGAMTYMVLTNAIYFKGEWVYEFDEEDTYEQTFHAPEGNVQAEMMHLSVEGDDSLPYYENDDLKALELPYKGDELSMVLVLPKTGDIDSLVDNLVIDTIEDINTGLQPKEVGISIPKFELERKYFLGPILKELGMVDAFGNADFSGMTEDVALYIAEVIHQTFIKVDEKGTEAAAATAVIMNYSSIDEGYQFHADSPFLYMIKQKETGNILFMGTMKDPTA